MPALFKLLVATSSIVLLSSTTAHATVADMVSQLSKKHGLEDPQPVLLQQTLYSTQGHGTCKGTIGLNLDNHNNTKACTLQADFLAYLIKHHSKPSEIQSLMVKRKKSLCGSAIATLDHTGAPRIGSKNPRIEVVEFFDFQCWACQRLGGVLDGLLKHYSDYIAIYPKQFPLKSHKNSSLASIAALAAHQQGKYKEMANLLFVISPDHTLDNILKYATEIPGLNIEQLKKDIHKKQIRNMVVNDKKTGKMLQVNATPTMFINNRQIFLPDDEFILSNIIDEILVYLNGPGLDKACR